MRTKAAKLTPTLSLLFFLVTVIILFYDDDGEQSFVLLG